MTPQTQQYAELAVASNFSFLTGASHPEELVNQAAELGLAAVAVTDTHTLAGIVRAHVAAREVGIPLVVGARIELSPMAVLLYPTDRASYGRLCRLITHIHATQISTAPNASDRAPNASDQAPNASEQGSHASDANDHPRLEIRNPQSEIRNLLLSDNEGLLAAVVLPDTIDSLAIESLAYLRHAFDDDRLSLVATVVYGPDDRGRLEQLAALAARVRVPLLATNDVHCHVPQRRGLQDVLTCIRLGCTLAEAGRRLLPNAERHLKGPEEMARLFAAYPQAVRRSIDIAERARGFSLDQLRYQYPDEICPPGVSPIEHLRAITGAGASRIYGPDVPAKVRQQIEHELTLIAELRYEPYFLTVYDLVKFAREHGILCQGRGAAANSAVCFCLGITNVDPARIDVLFERFVSRERNEPPDIDIDFEHERREEVLQYLYAKYGRARAALTAEVISYRGRLAVREVGKVLGLSADCVDRLAKSQDWWDDQPIGPEQLAAAGLSDRDPAVRQLVHLTNELIGFPRHLSQHVGGFVITRDALCELVPIVPAAMPDRTIIEWDKDDIDAMGMLKVDCLGLGMLTCIRKCLEFVNAQSAVPLTLATLPPEDASVYDMICRADTVGVFQIESRAQMSMLPRLRPRCFYDLVIEVGIVRPGPIVGDMVHPYLRRRQGIEPVEYPDDNVRAVLGKTLGIPLFQEQAMRLAIVAAGFSPDQADRLRRAIGSKRGRGQLEQLGRQFIDGMIAHGYQRDFAERCYRFFQGFSHYGFPESHAASFAFLVYASAWLKRYHPAAFAAALLNSQPMGFYAPAQIIADAQRHGVQALPADVNFSGWDTRLECDTGSPAGASAIRLGMRMVRSLSQRDAEAIERTVAAAGRFADVASLQRASGASTAGLRALAAADAFASMGLDRQAALWHIRAIADEPLPLFETPDRADPGAPACGFVNQQSPDFLPPVSDYQRVLHDYATVGVSLRGHPMTFLREQLSRLNVRTTAAIRDAKTSPAGATVRVAGVVLVRQRPSSAAGVIFMTIEDETGSANLMVRPSVFPRVKRALAGGVLLCTGRVQRAGEVVHVLVTDIQDISAELRGLEAEARNFR